MESCIDVGAADLLELTARPLTSQPIGCCMRTYALDDPFSNSNALLAGLIRIAGNAIPIDRQH